MRVIWHYYSLGRMILGCVVLLVQLFRGGVRPRTTPTTRDFAGVLRRMRYIASHGLDAYVADRLIFVSWNLISQSVKKKHTQSSVNTGIGFIKGIRGLIALCWEPRNTSRDLARRIPQTIAAEKRWPATMVPNTSPIRTCQACEKDLRLRICNIRLECIIVITFVLHDLFFLNHVILAKQIIIRINIFLNIF